MRRILFFSALFMAVFLWLNMPLKAQAASPGSVVINEIAWMGSAASTADEWIELRNTAGEEIDLTGWHLNWGGISLELTGTMPAGGYFLLERTDDDSVPSIAADQIYIGALSNSGELVVLQDADNNIIDRADWSGGWPAGNNDSKQTMERVCPIGDGSSADNWQNSESAAGTPRAANAGCALICEVQETSRQCIADSQAQVQYSYNNISCGPDYQAVVSDTVCACLYSDWSGGQCSRDGFRSYSRSELSGYDYCSADLTKEEPDETCQINNEEEIITAKGRVCWSSKYQWQCQTAELVIDSENITLSSDDISRQYKIVSGRTGKFFTFYLARDGNWSIRVIANNKGQNVMLSGRGIWFVGSWQSK